MTLEVGQTYKTKEGYDVLILAARTAALDCGFSRFFGRYVDRVGFTDHTYTWDYDGRFSWCSKHSEHGLVEQVHEDYGVES